MDKIIQNFQQCGEKWEKVGTFALDLNHKA